ncbi:MAG TPA: hypothetical protein VFS54_08820 [Solirubrobacterales bacterium]|nr:hypothetical protein [Solirubrobacterales bacterium]
MSQRQEDPRVEELLRVNAELAAEVRNLTLGYGDAPRPAGMPTTRRLGRLIEERDQLQAELEAARAELEVSVRHREELEQRQAELVAQVAELRMGARGVLRRVRARLLR